VDRQQPTVLSLCHLVKCQLATVVRDNYCHKWHNTTNNNDKTGK